MVKIIALYLPQYHPTPENDEWWGKGFTEWVNVAKARPLYRGHKEPHIPADLGFYDLRLSEVREQQAELARDAGVEAFCYYHYWFGNGRQILERPFNEVVSSGKPNFPFCLCWANHSWYKKNWNPNSNGKNILLVEQTYPGEQDHINHFMSLLPAFKDKRYFRVNGKLLFSVYDAVNFPYVSDFVKLWRRLAKENGLNDFYFITEDADSRFKNQHFANGFDAVYNVDMFNIHHHLSTPSKIMHMIERKWLKRPTVFDYKKAMKYMVIDDCATKGVIPTIVPNWDHSPRSGSNAIILKGSTPELFQQLTEHAIELVKDKPEDEQIIMLKSWNEWGEGNYMEPDLEFGHGYIKALRRAIDKHKNNAVKI